MCVCLEIYTNIHKTHTVFSPKSASFSGSVPKLSLLTQNKTAWQMNTYTSRSNGCILNMFLIVAHAVAGQGV